MTKQNGMKASESSIRYLPCQVSPGMFRGEFLVYLNGYSLENPDQKIKVQMLVDEKDVPVVNGMPKRNQPASGFVKVTLLKQADKTAFVILPQPAQPVGESLLVDASDLKIKPG
jgi:hypothetical protein